MLKVLKVFLICFVIVLCVKGSSLLAQSRNYKFFNEDARGKSELTLCSQNLENYGLYNG